MQSFARGYRSSRWRGQGTPAETRTRVSRRASPAIHTMSEPAGLSPAAATPMAVDGPVPPSGMDKLVLDYLRARGHKAAEQALLDVLDDGDAAPPPPTLDPVAFARELATFTDGPAPAETSEPTLQGLVAALGADEILAADPGDKQRGFRELESWVDGSLDMYRVCETIRFARILVLMPRLLSPNSGPYCSPFSATFTWILCRMDTVILVRYTQAPSPSSHVRVSSPGILRRVRVVSVDRALLNVAPPVYPAAADPRAE
jgi:hypothetical protein